MTSSPVASVPLVSRALTGSAAPVVFVLANKLPVPSSTIVPTPVAPLPPVLLTDNFNVSAISYGASLRTATRTNTLPFPAGTFIKSPAV